MIDRARVSAPSIGAALAALLALGCGSDPTPTDVALEQARAATERYQDVNVAIAEGFAPLHASQCVEDATGAMGVLYVNRERVMRAPALEEPAILTYVPQPDGTLQLGAIQYYQSVLVDGRPHYGYDAPPEGALVPPAEVIPGQPFEGPLPGWTVDMPWHYERPVWLYIDNPSGTFAAFNPTVACPQ